MISKLRFSRRACIAIAAPILFASISGTALADDGKFGATIYGFARVDAAYDTANMSNGDFAIGVRPQPTNGQATNEFTLTGNQSKIGVDLTAPDVGDAKVTGKIEFDFYNPSNTVDYRPTPQMRLGYVKMDWTDMKFSVLAGQAWDLFARAPDILNYGVFYKAGNIGYRHPAIQLSKGMDVGPGLLKVDVAAIRQSSDSGLSEAVSSADSGAPGFQGRVYYSTTLWTEKKATLGVSGSNGNERILAAAPAPGAQPNLSAYYTAHEWHAGVDVSLPILETLTLNGSWYRGQDLSLYLGLSTGIYATSISEMEDGGWAQLIYNLNDNIDVSAEYATASIEDGSDVAAGGSVKNTVYGLVAYYKFSKQFKVGAEWENWDSEFQASPNATSNRFQTMAALYF